MWSVIDVETTGFSNQDRIIEIGIVQLDENFQETERWGTLIYTDYPLHPRASSVNGITASQLAGKPEFSQVADRIQQLVDGRIIAGHNVAFDLRFLRNEFQRVGKHLTGNGFDTMRLWPGTLDRACADAGIVRNQTHRALADAADTAELLKKAKHRI